MKFLFLFSLILSVSCKTANNQTSSNSGVPKHVNAQSTKKQDSNGIDFSASPSAIIYKTKSDYYNKVAISLNDDKTKIVSYPGPKDVFYNGSLALPLKLHEGFLLDNRGIGKNVAFLNITYEDYSKLSEAPALVEMMKMIIDKEPLKEMYNCGSRYQYKEIVTELNKMIDNKQLSKFKKLL